MSVKTGHAGCVCPVFCEAFIKMCHYLRICFVMVYFVITMKRFLLDSTCERYGQ